MVHPPSTLNQTAAVGVIVVVVVVSVLAAVIVGLVAVAWTHESLRVNTELRQGAPDWFGHSASETRACAARVA